MTRLILALIFGIPTSLLRGLVLSYLLDWFFNLQFSVVQCIAVSLIATMLTYDASIQRDKTELLTTVLLSVFLSLLFWGVGFAWSFAL